MQTHLVVLVAVALLRSSVAEAAEANVTAPEAEIHSAPFDVAPVVARVHAGDRLTGDPDGQPGWLLVQMPDGRRGYLRAADAQLGVGSSSVPPPPAAVSASAPAASLGGGARAAPGEARRVGLAIHPEIGFLLRPPNGGRVNANETPGIASAGLGVGYDIRPSVEIEATVSTTASSSRATKDANGAIDYGTIVRALVHWHRHQTGFSPLLGAGPAVITGGNFGTVPLLHIEGGFEIRARVGFYLATVMQLVEPLATSAPEIAPAQCVTADCPSRFNPSDPILGIRAAVGYHF